jgi:valyl-tRNA synthetase
MTETVRRAPERPTADGLEEKWSRHWQEEGTYAFDRSKSREDVYAIDTPPPTVSGSLHMGHLFSYTHTDLLARFHRMRGKEVFYPMGWDDNGLPTERRVQNHFGVRCDPSLPYDPALTIEPAPEQARSTAAPVAAGRSIGRRNFVELCERLTAEDEQAFEALWRRLGLSVDWSLTYSTIGHHARTASQRAFLRNLARGEAYLAEAPTLWDVTFSTAVAQAELEDRERPGSFYRLRFTAADGAPVDIETTRPELLPACVALVCHPSDDRYSGLVGGTVRTPLFNVDIPVRAHPAAQPDKGSGIAMVCTFGDLTDVTWWRELDLDTRAVIGRDGRLLANPPSGVDADRYAPLAGLTVAQARKRIVELLSSAGALIGEPRPTRHAVKFYEKGEVPLEIVTSRQWYLANGGRDRSLREELIELGRQLNWVPSHMRHRYEHWVNGLTGDWLISRQRFFGVPFPVWYVLDSNGQPDYANPLLPDESRLPVDPSSDTPDGYSEAQRGQPGGFTGDPDVMDTWATSSLTPQFATGWERDPDLFARLYPMDHRAQGQEIIRTWLFGSVVRARAEFGGPPWRTAVLSGWILDPDRKKMSKSRGTVVTPMEPIDQFGADPVRYWAACGRAGVDLAYDEHQMRIGRRLVTKLLNASKFVLGLAGPADLGGPVTSTVDRSMLAALSTVVATATEAFEQYDHTTALEVTERFFWTFCDDYIELVKERAYGEDSASARAALATALSVLLRLFAPVLPYATEEIWSWWQEGSVHRAAWPAVAELAGSAGDPEVLAVVGEALRQVRRAKSDRRLSVKTDVPLAEAAGPAETLERLAAAAGDFRAAGRIGRLELAGDAPDLVVTCTI